MPSTSVELPIKATDQTRAAFQSVDKRLKRTEQGMARFNSSTRAANGSVRGMRGAMGQLGFQIQDVAVQLQSGQNAMLVFGQQGSQIASIMGPQGAVVGALIAVGAALGTALLPKVFDSTDASKELTDALEDVSDVVKLTDENVLVLSDSMGKLAEKSREAVGVNLEFARLQAQNATNASAGVLSGGLEDLFGFLGPGADTVLGQLRDGQREGLTFAQIMSAGMVPATVETERLRFAVGDLKKGITELSDELGISEDSAFDLLQAYNKAFEEKTPAAVKSLQKTIIGLKSSTDENSEALIRYQAESLKTVRTMEDAATTADKLREANDRLNKTGQLPQTEKQIEGGKDLRNDTLKQLEEEAKARQKLEEQFSRVQTQVASPAERLRMQYEERRAVIEEYEALELSDMQAANDAKIALLEKYETDQKAIRDKEAAAAQGASQSILGITANQVGQLSALLAQGSEAGKAFFVVSQGLAAANAIIGGLEAAMAIRVAYAKLAAATANPGILAAGEVHANVASGLGFATAGLIAAQTVASFEGGGYTGPGIRAGGLDGKGGRLAIVHSNEKITDLERGSGREVVANVNIHTNNANADDMRKNRAMFIRMVRDALEKEGREL